jgi:imidazole glycerol-phosphate synthase subunit HisH
VRIPPDPGTEVVIVRTGTANLASVAAAMSRLGTTPRITEDAALVADAPLVVLPGVGAFGPAMAHLRNRGLDGAIRSRVAAGLPLLAICLGMQLLCHESEESPGVAGLGVAEGVIRRFPSSVRVPQMGWNRIVPTASAAILCAEWMYFANSYRLETLSRGWEGAMTEHGSTSPGGGAPVPFISAIEHGSILACQFHPELSGRAGLGLIARWMERALVSGRAPC